MGVTIPLNYWKLARISFDDEEAINSIFAELQTLDSFLKDTITIYMAGGASKDFIRRTDVQKQ